MWDDVHRAQCCGSWPPERVAAIEAISKAANAGALNVQLSQIKMAAFNGNYQHAREQLQHLLEQRNPGQLFAPEIKKILCCCFCCGEPMLVSDYIGAGQGTKSKLNWGSTDALEPREKENVIWTVGEDGDLTISFSVFLFKERNAESLFGRLVNYLPLISHVLEAELNPGTRRFLLGDKDLADGTIAPCSSFDNAILIPDSSFLHFEGYRSFASHFATAGLPWAQRKDVVYWRGSSSGHAVRWQELPRIRMCHLLYDSDVADKVDVGIVDFVQMSAADADEARKSGCARDRVSMRDMANYKYHIDIDGNSNSWPGLFLKLLSGSPTFKVQSASNYRQWYYDRLVAWEHFIPIEADMSDLVDKMKYLFSKPELASSVGESARRMANSLTVDGELACGAQRIAEGFLRA